MASLKYGTGHDPYCYNNSDVLINKLNIQDAAILEEAEIEITEISATTIDFNPAPYTFSYLKNIHKMLFADLYSWAGEIRTIGINKGNTMFCRPEYIQKEADKLFQTLADENYFQDTSISILIAKVAKFYGDLNIIHPFREGNGRSQRILFEHIVVNCGYKISWENISKNDWIQANINSVNCDYSALETIFSQCISE